MKRFINTNGRAVDKIIKVKRGQRISVALRHELEKTEKGMKVSLGWIRLGPHGPIRFSQLKRITEYGGQPRKGLRLTSTSLIGIR